MCRVVGLFTLQVLLGITAAPAASSAPPAAPGAAAEGGVERRVAHVSYVTGASIYVDAGAGDGIAVGQILEVVRGNAVVATLRVTYVSSHRALCEKASGDASLAAGDAVEYVPSATAATAESGAPPAPEGAGSATNAPPGTPTASRARPGGFGLHGRVGVRYLVVREQNAAGDGFSQPALDLFLDGRQMGGSPVDLSVDVRSRRTYRNNVLGASANDGLTSVYRLAVSYQAPGSPWRATVGRMFAPSLAAVNIFDGAEAEFRTARFSAGVFSGTQPDGGTLAYSTAIREHGGFLEWRSAPGSERRWSLTTGAAGSYEQNQINREFSFVQGNYSGKRLFLWLGEEVDLNRGWKQQAEGSSASLTSTYLNVRFRASEVVDLNAGYDDRRNVRLYRDRITPVTEFDDAYRTGGWAGATFHIAHRYSVGLDVRESSGGAVGASNGYTMTLGADRLTPLRLDVRTRSTRYTSDQVEGWLHSLSLGVPIGERWHIDLTGGVRDETNLTDSTLGRQLQWYGLDADVSLGRRWFLYTSWERSQGGDGAGDQAYSSLAFRF